MEFEELELEQVEEDIVPEAVSDDVSIGDDNGGTSDALILLPEADSDPATLGDTQSDMQESDSVESPHPLAEEVQSTDDADGEEGETELEELEELEESPSSTLPSSEPLPVYLVDEPMADAESYSISGGVYAGPISTTYLDYFAGIVQKLGINEHYIAYRAGQYDYYLAWGEGLEYDGYEFRGSALSYCRIYSSSNNYRVSYGSDTFYVTPSTGFVYSDLGDFPMLTEGGTHLEFTTILFAIGFAVVYSVCHDIFDYVMAHVYRK